MLHQGPVPMAFVATGGLPPVDAAAELAAAAAAIAAPSIYLLAVCHPKRANLTPVVF